MIQHKIIRTVIILTLSCITALSVFAAQDDLNTLSISTSEEFISFAENCRLDSFSQDLTVSLDADIDLSGSQFQGIPIFCGSFIGNGHTVSGLDLHDAGSYAGLFRYLSDSALVKDLNISGTIVPSGSAAYIGGIAGSNSGRIENCSFTGTVTGTDHIGGIAGINTSTGSVLSCTVTGNISGNHFVGGIAGTNKGIIEGSSNNSKVNTETHHNQVDLSDITIENLTGSEAAATATDIGGIAGTNSGYIHDCENHENVGYPHIGYNIGGIAGSQIGYISNCQNYASVSGRKEIGGITGQLEPAVAFTYSTDTLQILTGQLDTLSALSNRISGNLGTAATGIQEQIVLIQGHISSATDTLTGLMPDSGSELNPDVDAMTQGVKALSSELSAVSKNLNSILSLSTNVANSLAQDLNAMSDVIRSMQQTIGSASENIGGSISDASDDDTDDDSTAKIDTCTNYGQILADLNGGGIAGAICFESDLDPEVDIMLIGEISLNFSGAYRAVIVNCENTADICVKKQYAGGITGLATLGLVRACTNTGTISCPDAEYVGGIAGYSDGLIRSCNVKAQVTAERVAGGVAGFASTVSDSIALTDCQAYENVGGILGLAKDISLLTGNCYMILQKDIGAVDGISYQDAAQGVIQEDFLAQDTTCDIFREFTVTFAFADGTEQQEVLQTGESLSAKMIPLLPAKEGYQGSWPVPEGPLYFDTVILAEYVANRQTIQSDTLRDNGLPVALAEGSFYDFHTFELTRLEANVAETAIEAWQYTCSSPISSIYFLPPDGISVKDVHIMLCSANGQWYQTEHRVSGSYIVFSPSKADTGFCIVPIERSPLPYILAACTAVFTVAAIVISISVHKRKKKGTATEEK